MVKESVKQAIKKSHLVIFSKMRNNLIAGYMTNQMTTGQRGGHKILLVLFSMLCRILCC